MAEQELERADHAARDADRHTPPQVEPEMLPEGGYGYPSQEPLSAADIDNWDREARAAFLHDVGEDDEFQAHVDKTESPDHGSSLAEGTATLRAQIEAYRAGRAVDQDETIDHGMSY